jgi:hypothetical protein
MLFPTDVFPSFSFIFHPFYPSPILLNTTSISRLLPSTLPGHTEPLVIWPLYTFVNSCVTLSCYIFLLPFDNTVIYDHLAAERHGTQVARVSSLSRRAAFLLGFLTLSLSFSYMLNIVYSPSFILFYFKLLHPFAHFHYFFSLCQ